VISPRGRIRMWEIPKFRIKNAATIKKEKRIRQKLPESGLIKKPAIQRPLNTGIR